MSSLRGPRAHSTQQTTLPLIVEKDEDGFYVVECPILPGCYSQGKTLDEALINIQDVIALLAQEKDARKLLKSYMPVDLSFHTITVSL